MTADWFKMPNKTLQKISSKIINNVKGVNRVVYDITSKPPDDRMGMIFYKNILYKIIFLSF